MAGSTHTRSKTTTMHGSIRVGSKPPRHQGTMATTAYHRHILQLHHGPCHGSNRSTVPPAGPAVGIDAPTLAAILLRHGPTAGSTLQVPTVGTVHPHGSAAMPWSPHHIMARSSNPSRGLVIGSEAHHHGVATEHGGASHHGGLTAHIDFGQILEQL